MSRYRNRASGGIALDLPVDAFDKRWGTAEEHLKLLLKVAKQAEPPMARRAVCWDLPRTAGRPAESRRGRLVDVLKKVRSQAVGDGIKIAVENGAGDMQAWELKGLIEAEAGSDFVAAPSTAAMPRGLLKTPR